MAGILDNKSRVLDILITREGKRQIAAGDLVPEFISFSDGRSFYEGDHISGSTDASDRPYFQVNSSNTDIIAFENNDSGQLIRYDGGPMEVEGSSIFKITLSGSRIGEKILVSGSSEFASIGKDVLSGALDNFNNLMLIGTEDEDLDDQNFTLSTNNVLFKLPDQKERLNTECKVDESEPLFLDHRLSNSSNFMFLPPVNKRLLNKTDNGMKFSKKRMGRYEDIRKFPRLSFDSLTSYLAGNTDFYRGNAYVTNVSPKESETINFSNTSRDNNLVIQIFEANNSKGTIKKLDTIDFGEYVYSDTNNVLRRVIFAGKIFLTKSGIPTYMNLFTIILDTTDDNTETKNRY